MRRSKQCVREVACSQWTGILLAFAAVLTGGAARADERPPVKITMPPDSPVAWRGQIYTGVFDIQVARPGLIENVVIEARGWQAIDVDTSAIGAITAGADIQVPFQMMVGDPDALVTIRFAFDGRAVSKSLRVGPTAAVARGRDHPAVQVGSGAPDHPPVVAGDAITLHFTGRIIYDRPVMLDSENMPTGGTVPVGVDRIWVEVIDEDDISTETIWSGFTDTQGYFDTGQFQWDDCDAVGCDDPDLYVRWECDTGIVNVQDANDILEEDWSWSTEANTIDDFTGSFHDFGTLKPADSGQMPILHIHNSITRAHRWIEFKSGSGINTDQVDVQWPEDEAGSGAYHIGFFDEIYISPSRQWHEATHTHEYGHHFLDEYAVNEGTDYCNEICDDGDDCGHCMWCEETSLDAWNEGWPNWLADIVTRDYPDSYTFSDATPYTALMPRSQETLQTCDEDDEFHDPFRTEGFLGAILRDIEDNDSDPTPVTVGDYSFIEREDCLALGSDEIFGITLDYQPTTPQVFLNAFMLSYPQHWPRLYGTLRNIADEFVQGFPLDQLPPGPVQEVVSATHPVGEGGPLPCIQLDWDTPPDDVTGGRAYSIVWGTDPGGSEPDGSAEIIGSCITLTMGPEALGNHYISIRARDWADHWSNEWDVFGPFTATDCNSNGIVDVCEIGCSWTGDACWVGDWCQTQPNCGFAQDCNDNLSPDDCDVASGASSDCNENGVPDECENITHWDLADGLWRDGSSWREGAPPDPSDHVCIGVFPDQITSTLDRNAYQVDILACDENLTIATNGSPAAVLTIEEPSWVRGNLTLRNNNSVLRVNDRLDVEGLFEWTGSNVVNSAQLTGAGATYALGGMRIPSGVVHLAGHDLFLDGSSVVEGGSRIDYNGASAITIRSGATVDWRSTFGGVSGWFDGAFDNQGTFIKSTSSSLVGIDVPARNSGLMHVQMGTFRLSRQSENSGSFIADPGTILEFVGGGHEFLPSSSIVAETVRFPGGIAGSVNIRGTYNVSQSTVVETTTTFTTEADIVSYGANFTSGNAIFDAVVGAPVHFDTLTGGTLRFNSGDPVVAQTLTLQSNGQFIGPSPLTVNGTINWSAGTAFRGPGEVHSNGHLNIGPGGGQKSLDNRTLNIAGTATFNGSFGLFSAAVVNNLSTGFMDIRIDGTAMSSESPFFNNAGTLVKTAGAGTTTISPNSTNTGTIEVQTGLLQFRRLTQTAGEVFLNGGNFGMTQVSTPQPFQLQGGTLRGNGTVIGVVNNSGGLVSPGVSPGGITVQGAYTQGPDGTLLIEIAGLTPVTEFDQLTVTGAATLGGTLDVDFINSFTPNIGDEFVIVTAGARSGIFDNHTFEGVPSHITVGINTTPTALSLFMLQRDPPSGDCDFSETTELADYQILHGCFSGPSTLSPTPPIASVCRCVDMDLDDDVDLHDAGLFQNQFSGGF